MTASDPARRPPTLKGKLGSLSFALYAACFLLEAGLVATTFLRKHAYLPYLAPHYTAVLVIATITPIALGLLGVLAFVASLSRSRPSRYFLAGMTGVVTPLMCGLGFFWWLGVVFGAGFSQTVAQANFEGAVYRLDYATPGDPPLPGFILYECKPISVLCRQIGEISDTGLSQPLPDLELGATPAGLTVLVDHAPIATYVGGVLTCAQADHAPHCGQ